jgi:hypothetical protein
MRTRHLSLILIAALALSTPVLATSARLVELNETSLTLDVTFDGWQQRDEQGGIRLMPSGATADERRGGPVTPYLSRLIGLPDDRPARVIVEHVEWGDPVEGRFVEGFSDPSSVDLPHLSGAAPAILSTPVLWRHHYVSTLYIVPLRFEGQRAYPMMSVRIRVELPPPTRRGPVGRDRLVRDALLNGKYAQVWSVPKTAVHRSVKGVPSRKIQNTDLWLSGTMVRIEVESEGMYTIGHDDFDQLGLDLTGVDPKKLRIFGNGGAPLPYAFSSERDSVLIENAIHVSGESDGSFDDGDQIIFYGRAVNSWKPSSTQQGDYDHTMNPYVRRNVYWLHIPDAGGPDGLRMEALEASSSPTSVASTARSRLFIEQESLIYNTQGIDQESGLDWYSAKLSPGQRFSRSVQVDNPVATSSAEVRFGFNVRASYIVEVNGVPVDTVISGWKTRSVIPPGVLRNGSNVVAALLTSREVYSDWIELNWRRELTAVNGRIQFDQLPSDGPVRVEVEGLTDPWVFDIEDFDRVRVTRDLPFTIDSQTNAPRRIIALDADKLLSPATLTISGIGGPEYPDGLRNITQGAEYVIITHPDFMQAAGQLEQYIEERDTLEVIRVDITDVFNEYSWGLLDPTAIRDFLADAHFNWNANLQTVLLVGDGDYDYRNILSDEDKNWIPSHQRDEYSYDDFFCQFGSFAPQLVMGRLNVQSVYELELYINQLIDYETNPVYGPWRSRLTILADDEWEDTGVISWNERHIREAEEFSRDHVPEYMDIMKIYLGTYHTVYNPGTGIRMKPQATEDLISAINNGTLVFSFIGHGNAHSWTHETVLVDSRDDKLINSGDRPPIFVAATCAWGHWDRPADESHPEQLLFRPGGSIAIIAATRKTYATDNEALSSSFFQAFFDRTERKRIGESLLFAKLNNLSAGNLTYHCMGEPRMQPALPERDVQTTDLDPDSLIAFGPTVVSGRVGGLQGQALDPSFDGEVLVDVFDVLDTLVYTFDNIYEDPITRDIPKTIKWTRPGGRLFRGLVSVEGGEFTSRFIVPRDVRLGTSGAEVKMYAFRPGGEGAGTLQGVRVSRQVAQLVDNTPPEIGIYFDQEGWRSGDVTSGNPVLHVELFDSNGINLTGDIGHDILAVIDGDREIQLTENFLYDRDSYSRGSVEHQLLNLEPGRHTLEVWAWDIANNFNHEEVVFHVIASQGEVALANVLNWPNPFSDVTSFTFELSAPARVTIKIFTAGGRLVRTLGPVDATTGFNYPGNTSRELRWNGWDRYGDPVANGVYLYKVIAEDESGQSDEVIGKLLRVR